jgi:hypothetical protein
LPTFGKSLISTVLTESETVERRTEVKKKQNKTKKIKGSGRTVICRRMKQRNGKEKDINI